MADFIKTKSLIYIFQRPWTTWVGWRYLKSKKNSKFLSFISLISVSGVALGVTSMITVLSVMDGFENELKKRLMNTDLHILITPKPSVSSFDQGMVLDTEIENLKAMDSRIKNVWPILATEAILRTEKKIKGIILKGVDDSKLEQIKASLSETADPRLLRKTENGTIVEYPSVYLGQELSFELGMMPGDVVSLISPIEMEGPLAQIPKIKKFIVQGIYHSGLPEQELQVGFTSAKNVRAFIRKAGVVTQWEIAMNKFDDAQIVSKKLAAKLSSFNVKDWIALNSHLFSSLLLERIAMFVILAFIIIVASFNIVTTLTLMVLEKKKEISILRAMGAHGAEIGAVFLSEGLFIGVTGILLGAFSGFTICSLLRRYEFITLPDIYYDRTLPVTFDPNCYWMVCFSAFAIVLIACLYPSQRASQITPLEGIRFG